MKLKNNLSIESQMQTYIRQGFYPAQLRQIRQGLEKDIDVSAYAHIQYNALFMELLRELTTFDNEFDINNYVSNGTLDVRSLLTRHTSLAHPHGDLTPFSESVRKDVVACGPYYVNHKGESIDETNK